MSNLLTLNILSCIAILYCDFEIHKNYRKNSESPEPMDEIFKPFFLGSTVIHLEKIRSFTKYSNKAYTSLNVGI